MRSPGQRSKNRGQRVRWLRTAISGSGFHSMKDEYAGDTSISPLPVVLNWTYASGKETEETGKK